MVIFLNLRLFELFRGGVVLINPKPLETRRDCKGAGDTAYGSSSSRRDTEQVRRESIDMME